MCSMVSCIGLLLVNSWVMKKLSHIAAAVALLFAAAFSAKADDMEGLELKSLWKQYESYTKEDKPKKAAEVLTQIKKKAREDHLAYDFYKAGQDYINVRRSINWKESQGLYDDFAKEVEAFGDPTVTYAWMRNYGGKSSDERFEFVKKNASKLEKVRNVGFYSTLCWYMGGDLKTFVPNDYEYALWDLFINRSYDPKAPEKDAVYSELISYLDGKYPGAPYLEYLVATRLGDEKKAAMEALSEKYEGKAVRFYPRADLLMMRFGELHKDNKGTSEDFKALRKDCAAYEKERKALAGTEAVIARSCTLIEHMIKTLDSKGISVSVRRDSAVVGFRNLDKAVLTLSEYNGGKKGKVINTWNLANKASSFYVIDKEKIALPSLDDGEYLLKVSSGKETSETIYEQFNLSIATTTDADGIKVYVADYLTGKPVKKATLRLLSSDVLKAEETVVIDGFTLLPEKIRTALNALDKRKYCTLEAFVNEGGKILRSRDITVSRPWVSRSSEDRIDGTFCNIYKDRGAYNPGDTVKFKAVLFKGNLREALKVLPGVEVDVILNDTDLKEIARKKLTTNEFGSVAGEFALPKGEKNGYYNITVSLGKDNLAYDTFRVDEFELPSFVLDFDKNEVLYMPGDTVSVSGKVKAYSGHNLKGATISAKVTRYGTVIGEYTFAPSDDGSFSFSFPADEGGRYDAEVKVTDGTGETLEFNTGRYVLSDINLNLEPQNASDAQFVTTDEKANIYRWGKRYNRTPDKCVFIGNEARIRMTVTSVDGDKVPLGIQYKVLDEKEKVVLEGKASSGDEVLLDISKILSGLYTLKAISMTTDRKGKEVKEESSMKFMKLLEGETALDAPLRRIFISAPSEVAPGDKIRLTMGSADGPVWAIATLFGKDLKVLETRKVFLPGKRGEKGSLDSLEFDYKDSYPDAVCLRVFYFKNGDSVTYTHDYFRKRTTLDLPLSFSSFTDSAYPSTKYRITLESAKGVEALAAVYDKSIDAISTNYWPTVSLSSFSVSAASVATSNGRVSGEDPYGDEAEEESFDGEVMIRGYGSPIRAKGALGGVLMSRSAATVNMAVMDDAVEVESAADEAIPFQLVEEKPMFGDAGDVTVRSKFEAALTFQPFLRSDKNGKISFEFETSDKLSTYYVSVFAHDKDMRNALQRREMVVSVPVKVAALEPRFLYEGDVCDLGITVSSTSDKKVSGKLYLYTYPGEDYENLAPVSVQMLPVTVEPGGTSSGRFFVRTKEVGVAAGGENEAGERTIGVKAVFAGDHFSDALFVKIPLKKDAQTLVEAHSAVLRGSSEASDREALISSLKERFVNVPASEASLSEISIIDMVKEAIPSKVEPSGKDVLSLSEAYYVRLLAGKLLGEDGSDEDLLERIMACRNSDGGFGWFEGMSSSQIITAVLLERFSKLRDRGFSVPDLTSSVKFLDSRRFETALPLWCGWISDEQYMFIRSKYASVPFDVKVTKDNSKRISEFKKEAKDYLVPSKSDGRGLNGRILSKARRIMTLQNLSASSEGKALAKAWGLSFMTGSRLKNSLKADLESLYEYAVEHPDGGWYYPNAVMPWRGLLESEAYAHSTLCDLLSHTDRSDIADGIRLWLMLQKETQKWDEDPAFVDALTSILDGSEDVLATKVLILKAEYTKPFESIVAAGNGFTIERKFFREVTVEEKYNDKTEDKNRNVTELQEIKPGEQLHVGDKILMKYCIWNQENRSFVRLTAPREASLRPVDQLSGHYGWRFNPLRISRFYTLSPQGYRNVKAEKTEYYFDSYPEEKTEITEEFFVTEAGTFKAPVVSIESLYAPHYRANDGFKAVLDVAP